MPRRDLLLPSTVHETDAERYSAQAWMLPCSTLMLMLMILFSALYSFAKMGSFEYETAMSAFGGGGGTSDKEIELAKSMKSFVSDMRMEGLAEVSVTAHSIKLKLSSPVVFDTGNAELMPEIMPLLVALLKHLKEMDNTIIVEGHTDDIPISGGRYRNNWELSAARAFSVIHFYIDRGIDTKRLLAHGYGPHRPLMPNTTELRRAINRRIEITILRGS